MSTAGEITVPETKPATEWVNGRALQKVSPREQHALAQTSMAAALLAWAKKTGSGRVGTEWEFRVTPPHEATRPLVPDVAFLSFDRLGFEQKDSAQIPYMAPSVAIEAISPDDRLRDIEEKVRVYLAAGAALVLLIDPAKQTFVAHDVESARWFFPNDTFTHDALPGFSVRVSSIFEPVRPKA